MKAFASISQNNRERKAIRKLRIKIIKWDVTFSWLDIKLALIKFSLQCQEVERVDADARTHTWVREAYFP